VLEELFFVPFLSAITLTTREDQIKSMEQTFLADNQEILPAFM
jgi:hypothetical protein